MNLETFRIKMDEIGKIWMKMDELENIQDKNG
jgi:hypothetical protein